MKYLFLLLLSSITFSRVNWSDIDAGDYRFTEDVFVGEVQIYAGNKIAFYDTFLPSIFSGELYKCDKKQELPLTVLQMDDILLGVELESQCRIQFYIDTQDIYKKSIFEVIK